MNIRTEKQASALTQRRNDGLNNAAIKDPGFSCQGKVGEFVSLYLRCELFATRLQHYYQSDKRHKEAGLNTDSLSKSLEHFGLHFENEKLLFIFQGGAGKRGKKSARQLRNGYLHQLSDADKSEIIEKHSTLTIEMRRFLKKRIKNDKSLTCSTHIRPTSTKG